ncbi:GDSL-type esterase/lipase family protein [Shouchella sp. 1P09AA]|uniref:GDSL-type esterase/lipase family protein n=1 Tax=unclassified Shouchella TaxID=2893065 RepID=UPI0039A3717A
MHTYLAIGDSLTTAEGSSSQSEDDQGFVLPYLRHLKAELREPFQLKTLVQNMATARQLYWFASNYQHEQTIYDATVITITTGRNDFLDAFEIAKLTKSDRALSQADTLTYQALEALIRYIVETKQHARQPYFIRIFNLYNPYPETDLLDEVIRRYNKKLMTLETYKQVKIINAYDAFQKHTDALLATDHEQPNDAGYQTLVAALIGSGLSPLKKP